MYNNLENIFINSSEIVLNEVPKESTWTNKLYKDEDKTS